MNAEDILIRAVFMISATCLVILTIVATWRAVFG